MTSFVYLNVQSAKTTLRREIGATALALNAMNLAIGSGIFVLPGLVAKNLGPSGFIAYLACGLLIILIMLCYAEVGSKVITTGGSYAYVEKAFGPLAGFLINTLFWVGFSSVTDAAVINAMADMLSIWFHAFSITWVRVIFFIAMFSTLAAINIRGVKQGSFVAVSITLMKLLPLIFLVLIGVFNLSAKNLAVHSIPPISKIGETSFILFFAFMGLETALNISGEIKEPRKNIPRGIFMGVAGVLIMYLAIQLVAQGVMGDALGKNTEAPLSALASMLIGTTGGNIILITSIISMVGLISGDILTSSRLLFAASKDGLLPAFLGRIHQKFATPYWAIILYSAAGLIFASLSDFKKLAELGSSSVLIIYLAVALATIRLRFRKDLQGTGNFTIPGGIIVPILAIICIGWFLSHITKVEIKALSIFFASLTVIYFAKKALIKNTKPG